MGNWLLAGDLIEDVIGRFFPISTMAAAATGNLISDIVGTYAAGGVKYLADLAGAPEPDLASAQKALPIVRQVRLFGEMVCVHAERCIKIEKIADVDTGVCLDLPSNLTHALEPQIGVTTGCLIGMTPLLFRTDGARTGVDLDERGGAVMLKRSSSTLDNIKC